MKKLHNLKKHPVCLREQKGMTLVEVIVALALLTIVVVLIGTALVVGLNIMSKTMPRSKNSLKAAGTTGTASLAAGASSTDGAGTAVSAASGSVTINLAGGTLSSTVTGTYETGTTSDTPGGSVTYWNFTPN